MPQLSVHLLRQFCCSRAGCLEESCKQCMQTHTDKPRTRCCWQLVYCSAAPCAKQHVINCKAVCHRVTRLVGSRLLVEEPLASGCLHSLPRLHLLLNSLAQTAFRLHQGCMLQQLINHSINTGSNTVQHKIPVRTREESCSSLLAQPSMAQQAASREAAAVMSES